MPGAGGRGGGAGTGGGPRGPAAARPAPRRRVYNGLRGQDFNSGWKFNRGDVADAQATAFNDAVLEQPRRCRTTGASRSPFNQNSPAGANGGYLDGGIGWYRKTFTVAGVERASASSSSSTAST